MDMKKLKIEYLPVEDLEEYKNNTRKHGSEDVDQIVKSIEKFGFDDPIGIWSDHNVIVEGHGRLMAAKKLGMNTVPCIRLDHLTDKERREYGIMHNKTAELSEWDREMLKKELADLDLSDFDLDWGFEDETEVDSTEPEEDGFEPQPKAQPMIQHGDIILLGRHKLICGDATSDDIDKLMAGTGGADLLVTDPPYNVALGYNDTPEKAKKRRRRTDGKTVANDEWSNDEEFVNFLVKAFNNAFRNMKSGAPFYIWYAIMQTKNFLDAAQKANITIRQHLIWVKDIFSLGRQDYQWRHEPCLYGWKEGEAHYFVDDRTQSTVYDDSADIDKMTRSELRDMLHNILDGQSSTVIHEMKPRQSDLHPTMKPIKLIGRHIKNSSKPGDIVLDIFGGSGSTLIACEQLGRTCYTAELDPSYAETIVDRYAKFTHQKDDIFILRDEETFTYEELKEISKIEEEE